MHHPKKVRNYSGDFYGKKRQIQLLELQSFLSQNVKAVFNDTDYYKVCGKIVALCIFEKHKSRKIKASRL